jgi:DNA-binding response OmpR family regulator
MRLLIIDPDKMGSFELKRFLQEEAFAVDCTSNGEKGSYLARVNEYDFVVLEYDPPGRSGAKICDDIRKAGNNVPIIGLISTRELEHRLELFVAGADDCILKPYSFKELFARMRAILRRGAVVKSDHLFAGKILLNCQTQTVRFGRKLLLLSRKEFALLELLLRNKGAVVSRSVMFEHVWNMDIDPTSKTIDAHICSLRQKLGPQGKKVIRNIQGRGYLIDDYDG